MMTRMAALAFAMAVGGGTAVAQDVGGRYYAEGTNADGSRYSGTAVITVTSENTCRIDWDVGSTSTGICMRNRNAFAASYVLGSAVGLVIYEIEKDGSMHGIWTVADQPGVGTEILTPVR